MAAVLHSRQIHIFCDGGFANRVNSLASGLAAAEGLGLSPVVHWPQNNWCRAAFGDIFTNSVELRTQELHQLKAQVADMIVMLHDTIASDVLGVAFHSAYRHQTLAELQAELALQPGRDIFYYPAVMPAWLDTLQIRQHLARLHYRSEIIAPVRQFITEHLAGPYHSIHLRRTDLTVGLSDEEVRWILERHADQRFYICSDDAQTEAALSRLPNAHIRPKSAYVDKMTAQASWNALTHDTAGRLYGSNIDRNSAAVIEGVIDLLVLSQGSIVGNSGSTFQSLARLYGHRQELSPFELPSPIPFIEMRSISRRLQSGAMTGAELKAVCDLLQQQGRNDEHVQLLRQALNHFRAPGDLFVICFNLANALIGRKDLHEALIFLNEAMRIAPNVPQALELHARLSAALKI